MSSRELKPQPQRSSYIDERSKIMTPSSSSMMSVDGGKKKRKDKKTSSSSNVNSYKKDQSSAAEEARAINQSLLRTKSMMHSELGRLSHASETIQSDENALKTIKEDQMGLDGAVKGSKGALGQMSRQDREDMIVLSFAIAFFVLSALYVVWCRVRIPFIF